MSRLTDLQLVIDQSDTAVVSFALLQGHLRSLNQETDSVKITAFKMDLVLHQLYTQYYTIQKEYIQGNSITKNMLSECNNIIKTCKQDRQQLLKMNQDRLRLVKELKISTDESLQYLQENQQLKKMVNALQQLNELLNTRYTQMQEQFKTNDKSGQIKQSIKGLKEGYKSITDENSQIQKDMQDISKQASIMQQLSLPIRVISIAFNSNKSLKQLVMRQAEFQLGENQQLRDLFINCKFDMGEVQK